MKTSFSVFSGFLLLTLSHLSFSADLTKTIELITPAIIEARHRIHQYPELGNREFETAQMVAEHMRGLGLEVETQVGVTGVVGLLKGGKPGPIIAVRADMDALPVEENTDFPFASKVRTNYLGKDVGVMHACGHDVHVAVQMGVISVLAQMRSEIPGTIKFIFQPAEEGPPPGEEGGAEVMLADGVFKNPKPEAVFGLHTFSELNVGKLGYTPGPAFAAVDHFIIKIRGKQAHGAAPHLSVDPVVMASRVVLALQTIRSRNLSPLEPSVITVGIIQGGERFNIIPAEVHLEGTVRTYNPAVRDAIERRFGEIIKGITESEGGSFSLDYERGSPATINNIELTQQVAPSLAKVVGQENVVVLEPTMGGEDFSFFANEVPGFYYRLGTVDPKKGSGGHHTPEFRADDKAIPIGIEAMTTLILDYLNAGGMNEK
jgi:amidohydrolase